MGIRTDNGVDWFSTAALYSACFQAFTPAATATDFLSLMGSATKTVRLLRVAISGIATAAAAVDIALIKRSAANTGGTTAAIVGIPNDSGDAASSASLLSWTANPGALGAVVAGTGKVRAKKLGLTATPAIGAPIVWDWATRLGMAPVLRGVAEGLHLNWGGAAVPAGTLLVGSVEWLEQ